MGNGSADVGKPEQHGRAALVLSQDIGAGGDYIPVSAFAPDKQLTAAYLLCKLILRKYPVRQNVHSAVP